MGAAFVLPFATWLIARGSTRMIVVAAIISALAIYKHRSNIQRLLNGTESRFEKKREASP
jgi:glycerol-3-phosphate acyltransferase PlsY